MKLDTKLNKIQCNDNEHQLKRTCLQCLIGSEEGYEK